jgi:hypothetical protein
VVWTIQENARAVVVELSLTSCLNPGRRFHPSTQMALKK